MSQKMILNLKIRMTFFDSSNVSSNMDNSIWDHASIVSSVLEGEEVSDKLRRNPVTQSRLKHCLLTHIYKEKLDQIDLYQIMSKFIALNEKNKLFLV